jgi:hypothetical protein
MELGYSCMDLVDYMLLPLIFLFQMAYTLNTLIVSCLVHSFHHNMFVVIYWEGYVIVVRYLVMYRTLVLLARLTKVRH